MNLHQFWVWAVLPFLLVKTAVNSSGAQLSSAMPPDVVERWQTPGWSDEDLEFFLHGTMSTELVPETILRALIAAYPDMFPKPDLSNFGLIPDAAFGWPVGFSREKVTHLGGLTAVGINCAACHVGEVVSEATGQRVRVLGMTSLFDAEAYFGALLGATFRTADPANMKRFLGEYLQANDPTAADESRARMLQVWGRNETEIASAMADFVAHPPVPGLGSLYPIRGEELDLSVRKLEQGLDLPALTKTLLRLFHNIRAALHVPDKPPEKAPPRSGPGRNDAFGLLSAVLFGAPQPYAPVKYGLVWDLDRRRWVHWDGNTQSPLGRNLLASLGLGAPLIGKEAKLEFAKVQRQTDLSESIRSPRYPFAVDRQKASRGFDVYRANCASCHNGPEADARLYSIGEIRTEPKRGQLFTRLQADRFNQFLAGLEINGYKPADEPGIRSTEKYWASSLSGVWARSPYLHNGSVRTMRDLLMPAEQREKSFRRGVNRYDERAMGYVNEGGYELDTRADGNSNAGHEYGTDLPLEQKEDLIEYLKTL